MGGGTAVKDDETPNTIDVIRKKEGDDDFKIIKDEDPEESECRTTSQLMGELFKELGKLKHNMLRQEVLGITERIYEEDRDASALFCNGMRRCEIHGIMCIHPNCNICAFVTMHRDRVAAIMANLEQLYETEKNWSDDGENGDGVPKDLHKDSEEH